MKRKLLLNEKKIKELVSNVLEKKYEDVSVQYDNHDDLIIELKEGHFIEQIPFTDRRILQALNLETLNLELNDVSLYEDEYAYSDDEEQKTYVFSCNDLKEKELEK